MSHIDKRYQVFVSSTYADLKDERSRVIQTLMEMDCIPSGMELFPAMDEEQFDFIKKVIDDCDYYLLVIGGRYGSVSAEGVSYTEQEYDYAIARGLKVIALIHGEPDSIPVAKTDKDPDLARRLNAFREKVQTGRLVRYWQKGEDLPGIVALSLQKTIRTYPAIGWIRGDSVVSQDVLEELRDLRKENDGLRVKLKEFENNVSKVEMDVASLDVKTSVFGEYNVQPRGVMIVWKWDGAFKDLFAIISPYLLSRPGDDRLRSFLLKDLLKLLNIKAHISVIDTQAFFSIMIQFKALGLVEFKYSAVEGGDGSDAWILTEKGEHLMMELRCLRSPN